MNFIASPEIVVAFGLAGRLTFNPMKDSLQSVDGTPYKLEAPNIAPDVPSNGFVEGDDTYVEPPTPGGGLAQQQLPPPFYPIFQITRLYYLW
mgnify:CR=1 FL=1